MAIFICKKCGRVSGTDNISPTKCDICGEPFNEGDALCPDTNKVRFDFGERKQPPLNNDRLLSSRLHLVTEECDYPGCDLIKTEDGKVLGILPKISVDEVWKLAKKYNGEDPGMSHSRFKSVMRDISEKLDENSFDSYGGVLVQNVWTLHEQDFLQLYEEKGSRAFTVLGNAIRSEISACRSIEQRWHKIKHYRHKVPLQAGGDSVGLFNEDDVAKLRRIGINYLNDIRKHDVYELKNLFLDYELDNLPEDINAAFKEDLERRKDFRYKVWPFVIGLLMIVGILVPVYKFQYTIIKEQLYTAIVIGELVLWAIMIALIIRGGVRARWRRRTKRPRYYYFTKGVVGVFCVFVALSAFMFTSTTVFYERYDGFDDNVYYRNLDDGNVTVAGLRFDDTENLKVPQTIDDKTVTEVAANAFKSKGNLVTIQLPKTVKDVHEYAFANCTSLTDVNLPEMETIPEGLFAFCESLRSVEFPQGVTEIGKKAFANCTDLRIESLPRTVTVIGDQAFANCESITGFTLDSAVTTVGNAAFKGCTNLRSFYGAASQVDRIEKETFADCDALESIDMLESVSYVGDRAFAGCESLQTVEIGKNVEEFGSKVFVDSGVEKLTIPFIGKTRDDNRDIKYLFGNTDNLRIVLLTDANALAKNAFAGKSVDSVALEDIFFKHDEAMLLGEGAFKGCKFLVSVILPSQTTQLPKNFFSGCESLLTVDGLEDVETFGDNCFKGCAALESLQLTSAAEIGNSSFEDCTALRQISVPAVAKIGKNAFRGCSDLDDVVLPKTLESLGKNVFADCDSLKTLTLPFIGANSTDYRNCKYLLGNDSFVSSITVTNTDKVADRAFADLWNLSGVTFECEITELGHKAFSGCNSLVSFTIPSGIKELYAETFDGCFSLTTVVGVENVETLGDRCFNNCSALENIRLNNAVKLGKNCFAGCTKLQDIYIPEVQEIGDGCFENCRSLESLDLSRNDVTSLGKGVFENCTSLQSVDLGDREIIPNDTFNGCTSLKSFDFQGVSEIGDRAFRDTGFEKLSLPNGVTKLGKESFAYCGNLRFIQLPSSVTELGRSVFDGNSITEAEMPFIGSKLNSNYYGYRRTFGSSNVGTLTLTEMSKINRYTFRGGADLLHNVILNDNVTKIGTKAFYKFTVLNNVAMPDSLQSVGRSAFSKCTNLTTLHFPDSVTELGNSVARGCTSLSSLYLPNSLEKIPANAFRDCSDLEWLEIPDSVTYVGKRAFYHCFSLATIDFGEGLDKIDNKAFSEIDVEELNFNQKLRQISYRAFENCENLQSLNFGDSLERLGNKAFAGCTGLTNVTLPDTLQSMGNGVLDGCSSLRTLHTPFLGAKRSRSGRLSRLTDSKALEEVWVTDATRISYKAFANWRYLTEIHVNAGVTKVGKKVFNGCDNLLNVYVPRSFEEVVSDSDLGFRVNYID